MNNVFDKIRFPLAKTKFYFKDSFPLNAVSVSTSRYQSLKKKIISTRENIGFH